MLLDKAKKETNYEQKQGISFLCDCTVKNKPIPHVFFKGKISLKIISLI